MPFFQKQASGDPSIMKLILTLLCLSGPALQLTADESPSTAAAPGVISRTDKAAPAVAKNGTSSQGVTADDLNQLRERIAKQEEEIKRLQQSVEEQRVFLEQAIQKSKRGPALANTSTPTGSEPVKLVPVVNVAHPDIGGSGRAGQKTLENPSPLSISIGNTTFTPLGFVSFRWYGRSTNVGSGIGTSFGGIPYNNSVTGRISENNFSAQDSRLGFRVDSTVLGAKVLGYLEADFLGNAATNVFVTSNSNTFRMRNVFIDVQKNGLEVMGGQDWTLFTPNRKGLSPVPSDIFYTQNMDTNYQVGLIWSRQSQFRLIAHPNDNVAFGVSLENPQQYVGGPGVVTFPAALSTAATGEFNNTTTAYSVPNLHPDIIFKAAYDGHAGDKVLHLEAGALIRSFKFVNAVGKNPTTYISSTATAVSGEANANLEIVKHVRLIANTFFGSGGGRYIFGLGPDVIVRADGSISPVHAYSTLDGFEANITKDALISMLYGGAYFGRDTGIDTDGSLIGYGFAGSATNNNRTVQEATFDLVQTFWKNPNYGALSLIAQYSYLWRNPWSIPSTGARYAKTNLFYLEFRYTLP
jgi:hypothetical protein